MIKSLKKVQNSCLQRIMSAYKQTSRAVLKRETQIIFINLHIKDIK